jgi:hypothetical protein
LNAHRPSTSDYAPSRKSTIHNRPFLVVHHRVDPCYTPHAIARPPASRFPFRASSWSSPTKHIGVHIIHPTSAFLSAPRHFPLRASACTCNVRSTFRDNHISPATSNEPHLTALRLHTAHLARLQLCSHPRPLATRPTYLIQSTFRNTQIPAKPHPSASSRDFQRASTCLKCTIYICRCSPSHSSTGDIVPLIPLERRQIRSRFFWRYFCYSKHKRTEVLFMNHKCSFEAF